MKRFSAAFCSQMSAAARSVEAVSCCTVRTGMKMDIAMDTSVLVSIFAAVMAIIAGILGLFGIRLQSLIMILAIARMIMTFTPACTLQKQPASS